MLMNAFWSSFWKISSKLISKPSKKATQRPHLMMLWILLLVSKVESLISDSSIFYSFIKLIMSSEKSSHSYRFMFFPLFSIMWLYSFCKEFFISKFYSIIFYYSIKHSPVFWKSDISSLLIWQKFKIKGLLVKNVSIFFDFLIFCKKYWTLSLSI